MRILGLILFFVISVFGVDIKIATFNVENLFDGKNHGTEYRDFKIGKSNWSNSKYLKKSKELSKFLSEVGADIVALQEIENEDVLRRLASGSDYKYYKFSKPKGSPFGVGVMSKIKIDSSSYYRFGDIKTRDILRVNFKIGEYKFSLFNLHFLSQKNSKFDRKKEINQLLKFCNNALNAIIVGDFNEDYKPNYALKPLEDRFRNLWKEKFGFERSSHISGRAIDHIFLDKSFFGKENALNFKSFKVVKSSHLSDHDLLLATLSTQVPKTTATEPKSLDDIYKIGKFIGKLELEKAAITYTDKFGYAITQKGGRGIYVYDKDSKLSVGDLVDATIYSVDFYKENLEVKEIEIKKVYDEKADLKNYTKELSNSLRAGDTISLVSGKVINGRLYYGKGNIPIYSKNSGALENSSKEMTFKNAFVINFRGELELLVR